MIVHYSYKRLWTILQLGLLPGNCLLRSKLLCFIYSTVINKRTSHAGSNKYYLNGVLLANNVNVLDLGITIG